MAATAFTLPLTFPSSSTASNQIAANIAANSCTPTTRDATRAATPRAQRPICYCAARAPLFTIIEPRLFCRKFFGRPANRRHVVVVATIKPNVRCSADAPEAAENVEGATIEFQGATRDAREIMTEIGAKLGSNNARVRLDALDELEFLPAELTLAVIEGVLRDSKLDIVRSQAMWALVNLAKRNEEAIRVVLRVLESDSDYSVRAAAAGALGYIQDDSAVEALIRCYSEEVNWLVRYSAIVSLGNVQSPRAGSFLLERLKEQSVDNKDKALEQQSLIAALGELGHQEAVDTILQFCGSSDILVRAAVAGALGALPSAESLSALRYLEKDSTDIVFQQAQASVKVVEAMLAKSSAE